MRLWKAGAPCLVGLSFAALVVPACGSDDGKKQVPRSSVGEGGGAGEEDMAAAAGVAPVGGAAAGAGDQAGAGGARSNAGMSQGGATDGGSAGSDAGAVDEAGAGGAETRMCESGYSLEMGRCVPVSCAGMVGTECHGGDCCASPKVTGGTFYRGTDTSFPATVSDFALDRLEVTVGRFKRFMSAYAGAPPSGVGAHPLIAGSGWNAAWNNLIAANKAALTTAVQCDPTYQTWSSGTANDQLPMNCVTWYEAFAFCAWDGGRLPTETEWEYTAAGGSDELAYPWGNTPVPTNLQDSTAAYAAYDGLGDGSAPGAFSLADVLAAGSKPMGIGKFGQLDLAGSMWEWTLDWYAPFSLPCIDCSNLATGGSRVLRGGSSYYPAVGLQAANRDKNVPGSTVNDYGFRCARTPRPEPR